MVAHKLVWHVISEVREQQCLLPDPLDGELRPNRYLQVLDLVLVEESLVVHQYLVHEVEATCLGLGQIYYIVVKRIR